MRIVSLNTWGRNGSYETRRDLIVSEVNAQAVDFLCLQEVFDSDLRDVIKKTCGFDFSFECHPAGLVILSRFPIQEQKMLTYKTISTNEKNDRRVIFIKTRIKNDSVWIGNTHLSWRPEDDEIRIGQVNELVEVAQTLDAHVILAGDFNCTTECKPIALLKKAGFLDVYANLDPKKDGFTWDNARNPYLKTHAVIFPDRRIDLILVKTKGSGFHGFSNVGAYGYTPLLPRSCNLCFTKPNGEDVFPSDHFGVMVEWI